MTDAPDFYTQEDIDIINEIASDGSKMDEEMVIDIDVAIDDEDAAQKLCDKLQAAGYEFEMFQDDETDELGVCVSVSMILNPKNVGDAQSKLQEIAAEFGGEVAGWGTYGNNFEEI